jgi:flavin-dependent dehydrogenase
VNVGIVVPPLLHAKQPPESVADQLIASFPPPREAWMDAPTTDHVAVAGRLEHHVSRAAGRGFVLLGDAIQFIDPLTGEGLSRALVGAELAADAIVATLRGDQSALAVYDRRIRNRWRSKNLVSWILQLFLAQPRAFEYALQRLAARDALREELTLVLTDQARASRAVDPRFLARLLAP